MLPLHRLRLAVRVVTYHDTKLRDRYIPPRNAFPETLPLVKFLEAEPPSMILQPGGWKPVGTFE